MLTGRCERTQESIRIMYYGGVLWMICGRQAGYISVDDGVGCACGAFTLHIRLFHWSNHVFGDGYFGCLALVLGSETSSSSGCILSPTIDVPISLPHTLLCLESRVLYCTVT